MAEARTDIPGAFYPPSWVDRVIDGVEALPGPAWIVYLLVFIAVAALGHVGVWVDGSVETWQLDTYQVSLGFYVAVALGAIHYLDLAASRAWRALRPVIRSSDRLDDEVAYELTTMPAGPTLAWTTFGLVTAAFYLAGQYGSTLNLERNPVTLVADATIFLASFGLGALFIYHTARQLRLIAAINDRVENVELLHLAPLYAFSHVTSATGIILLLYAYVSILTNPASFTNVGLIAGVPLVIAVAAACFVVPLYGMHGKIAAEKARRLEETNNRLERLLTELDRRADQMDLAEADAFNKTLSSVITQRQVITDVSTWPWQAATLRSFVTAMVAPVVLWLLYRFLERQLM